VPDGAVKCPTGPSNSRLYGGNVKSNAVGLRGVVAVGFDLYIIILLKYGTRLNLGIEFEYYIFNVFLIASEMYFIK
jgi:hypothetical protein